MAGYAACGGLTRCQKSLNKYKKSSNEPQKEIGSILLINIVKSTLTTINIKLNFMLIVTVILLKMNLHLWIFLL